MDRLHLGTSFPPSHLGKVIPLNHLELIDLLSTSFFILKKPDLRPDFSIIYCLLQISSILFNSSLENLVFFKALTLSKT